MKYFPLLLLIVIVLGSSFAAASSEDDFFRRSESEGALIAMAQFCDYSTDEVRSLASKLEQQTLLAAKASQIKLDVDAYHDYVIAGLESTRGILSYVPSSGPGYESNCEEVREKVSAAMAK